MQSDPLEECIFQWSYACQYGMRTQLTDGSSSGMDMVGTGHGTKFTTLHP